MPSSRPVAPPQTTTEERMARLSVLQELTVAALDLFDPESPADRFLERVAERLGCLAALWVKLEPDLGVSLVGAAGISEASRALPITVPELSLDLSGLTLDYPELARGDLQRWSFRLNDGSRSVEACCHALLLFFDPEQTTPDDYRAAVERLVSVLETVLSHRRLAQDLRRSYEELARTQLALVERERLAAVGELAAVVAHEVRNPLAVIFNCIGRLEKDGARPDDENAVIGILSEEANRLNQIVSELLDFARPGEARLLSESLEEIVDGAIGAVRSAHVTPVNITFETTPRVPPQMVDARLMRRAVINLLTNALQAMPEGGRVTVRVLDEPVGAQHAVRLEVSDEGPGISAAVQARIFEPFFTTKPSGTGLGLSIVRQIAEVHHGQVSVRSGAGKGTTFTLRLPPSAAAAVNGGDRGPVI